MSRIKIEIADELKHLSEDQIEELCKRYSDGETNASLCDEYKIKIVPGNLLKWLPPLKHNDHLCPYCIHLLESEGNIYP